MTAEQIILACTSGKFTAEEIIITNSFGTAKMIQYFSLNPQESTTELKHQIVDRIQSIVDGNHNAPVSTQQQHHDVVDLK